MISFDEAVATIASAARPIGCETVALDRAAGRVLAAPILAAIDSPRADVSAMDGYAVRSADLGQVPRALTIAGESFPGCGWSDALGPGACVRVFTGAPIPARADRVVIQEEVLRKGSAITIQAPPGPTTWIRPRGKDFRTGDLVLEAGRVLDPRALVAAAGADTAAVEVSIEPRLALLSTGDELVEPGSARLSLLAVPDSVSPAIAALAAQWGAKLASRTRLRDDLEAMQAAAHAAAEAADAVVVTGGASVGERDFAKRMFKPLGLELLFSKLSIRPGKPAWFGRIGDKLILGLPGNPTSALVTARLLLAPLLAGMQGRPWRAALEWEPVRLASALAPCDSRETFHRAHVGHGEATIMPFQESHAQKTLGEANFLVRQAAGSPALSAGDRVEALRF